jgi:hypothetical protein
MDEIIQNKVRGQYGWLKRTMWRMGIKKDNDTTTKHVVVSPEVKKAFLDKLCEIASVQTIRKGWASPASTWRSWQLIISFSHLLCPPLGEAQLNKQVSDILCQVPCFGML